jgi:flagellar protein FliO/FliZ
MSAPVDVSTASAGAGLRASGAAPTTALLVHGASSANTRPFAAPDAAGALAPTGIGGLTQVTLALALVVAAIFALAWLVRRLRAVGTQGAAALAVIGEVRLGAKERAVLIQAGTTQLLLGVAPGQVQALHVLPEPVRPLASSSAADAERPSFRALLKRSLGKS